MNILRKKKRNRLNIDCHLVEDQVLGVSIVPVAFLVVQPNTVKLLPVDHNSCLDRLLDYVPDLIDKINAMLNKQMQNKKDEKVQEDKRKEKVRQEEREDRKQEIQTMVEKNNKEQTQVKPKKNIKYHRPIEMYEFEYDETNDYYNNDDNS